MQPDPRFHLDATWRSGTERYRYMRERDLVSIGDTLSDADVGRWLWFAPIGSDDAMAYFRPLLAEQRASLERREAPDSLCFAVEDGTTGNFLGMGALVAVAGSEGGFEIGFQLRPHAWGRGVATRLSLFLRACAVDGLGAYRLEGACLEGNHASAALMRNLGLQLEGTFVDYRLRAGVRHTELRFAARVQDLDLSPASRRWPTPDR